LYFVKTPNLIKLIYPNLTWDNKATNTPSLYLTFDDGPHTLATPFVLKCLAHFNAKATFFCLGKNVIENITLYHQILKQGHSVGNHTHNHLNGYKTNNEGYLGDIVIASQHIQTNLFRPPYGRVTRNQTKLIRELGYKVIMWDVLSGDFDEKLPNEKCLHNVISNATNGSIIVFHDSQKALSKLTYALPKVLDYFSKQGYVFEKIATK
jgi:peptidoglycan-N-acetylglucosamine deacetylase